MQSLHVLADFSDFSGRMMDSDSQALKVLVVGAGIGGLVTAVTLKSDGHDVLVLDEATAFGEVR